MQEVQEMRVQSLGREDPPEWEVVTHSSILGWRIPWTEEPGGLHTVHEVAKSQTGQQTRVTIKPCQYATRQES